MAAELRYQSGSPEETRGIGEALGRRLKPGDVVATLGELGAGKTCFLQGLARGLGVEETATSPTFVLINQYRGRLPVYHVDAYRTESLTELQDLGLEEFFYGEGVTVVEWADRLLPLLPPHAITVRISGLGDEPREILIEGLPEDAARGMGADLSPYSLAQFVKNLRAITGETKSHGAIIDRVRPLARRLALSKEWLEKRYYACDAAQGFGVHLLHEEADHTLAVFAVAWLPGRGAPPHDHGTWAVVAGVDGTEKNVYWKRLDDGSRSGYAEIRQQGEEVVGPGEVVALLPDAIHSVVNETDAVTLSLHVYGKHLNYTGRSQFDPERNAEVPFIVAVQ